MDEKKGHPVRGKRHRVFCQNGLDFFRSEPILDQSLLQVVKFISGSRLLGRCQGNKTKQNKYDKAAS